MRKSAVKEIPQGYKNSPLGIIPNEWEVKRLDEISQMFSGGTPKSTEQMYFNGEIPFIKSGEISNAKTEQYLSELGLKNSSAKLIERGDLLYALYGATSGECALSKISGAINQAILCIRPTKDVDRYFLLSFLQKGKEYYYNSYLQGGQGNLSADIVKGYKILTPPLPEQRKIAEVLSTWDRAIEKQMLLVEKLELRKKGLMQQLLTGKKRLPGFSGGAWKKVKLGDIGQCYSGLTNKNKSDFECGAAKFITYMNVFCHGKIDINILGRVNIEADEKQEKVKKGDIFFTVSSETPEEVGMSSVLMDDVNNTYLNSFCFGFRLYNNEILLPKYAIYAFRGTDMRKNMYRIAQGSTRFNLSKDEVMSLKITVPTVQEQNAIAEILSVCDNEITLARQKLDTLRQQKKGLMQVLLTGKKRIKI